MPKRELVPVGVDLHKHTRGPPARPWTRGHNPVFYRTFSIKFACAMPVIAPCLCLSFIGWLGGPT